MNAGDKLNEGEIDAMPELFRVLADGNGRLIAVDEGGTILGVVLVDANYDAHGAQAEAVAHARALSQLMDMITPQLVDPMN